MPRKPKPCAAREWDVVPRKPESDADEIEHRFDKAHPLLKPETVRRQVRNTRALLKRHARKSESKLPGLRLALTLMEAQRKDAVGFGIWAFMAAVRDIEAAIRREEAREKGRGK